MTKSRLLLCLLFLALFCATLPVAAWERSPALLFAVLPDGATGPEGLVVGPDGTVYVATFGFNASAPVSGLGQLYSFAPSGKLLHHVSVQNSTSHLLGLGIHPFSGKLLVIDFGAGQVLAVNPVTGGSTLFMTLVEPAGTGLNAMCFDQAGNVYVSDSFKGNIYKTSPNGGVGAVWASSPLLTTTGVPPFGANGCIFNHSGKAMFVANTGDDRIIKIAVNPDHSAGAVSVFTNSINGADGVIIDDQDNLWVTANQEDDMVVVDPTGKAVAKLGDFYGVDDGVPRGLLFPATPYFSPDGRWVYVTNLALNLTIFSPDFLSIDTAWTTLVTRYTVSKIRARIPPIGGQN